MLRFFRFLILALALCPMAAMAKVNINTASVAALTQVNGINAAQARAIVDYRRVHGRFSSVSDLIKVRGINERTLTKIRPHVTTGKKYSKSKSKHHHHPHHR